MERILYAQEAAGAAPEGVRLDCYVIPLSDDERPLAVRLVRTLRDVGIAADMPYTDRALKNNLKVADKLGARFAALIGKVEREAGTVTLREMTSGGQDAIPFDAVALTLTERLG
jgi:histidyl-tRNA synthetase